MVILFTHICVFISCFIHHKEKLLSYLFRAWVIFIPSVGSSTFERKISNGMYYNSIIIIVGLSYFINIYSFVKRGMVVKKAIPKTKNFALLDELQKLSTSNSLLLRSDSSMILVQ